MTRKKKKEGKTIAYTTMKAEKEERKTRTQ